MELKYSLNEIYLVRVPSFMATFQLGSLTLENKNAHCQTMIFCLGRNSIGEEILGKFLLSFTSFLQTSTWSRSHHLNLSKPKSCITSLLTKHQLQMIQMLKEDNKSIRHRYCCTSEISRKYASLHIPCS
jgi:hypothetical protein